MTRTLWFQLRLWWSLGVVVAAVCVALFVPVHDEMPPPNPAGTGSGGGVFVLDERGLATGR